jgi:hypothetical protein
VTLDECRREVEAWLSIKLTTGRCSILLIDELAYHMLGRTLDVFCIYDEIGALEDKPESRSSSTKPASIFMGPVLCGLWHKHYTAPAFIVHNLKNHWTQARLKTLIADIEENVEVALDRKGDLLVHRLVIDGHRERHEAGRVTGEWIVFAKRDAGNIYLTLASHNEADEGIRARVDLGAIEFPDFKL